MGNRKDPVLKKSEELGCVAQQDESVTIPAGHFVTRVDMDAEEPYCEVVPGDAVTAEPKKILLPKSLAYYLSTHHCGSNKTRERLLEMGRNEVRNTIKEALGIE